MASAINALPIQIQTMSGASSALTLGTVPLASARIALSGTVPVDLDAEWARIQQIFDAGIRPSIDRA